MKQFFPIIAILISLVICSCNKTHNPDSPKTPTDTLATGWKKIVLTETTDLVDIFFINSTGFTISSNGIFKSADGGNNWSRITTITTGTGLDNIGMGSEMNAVFVSHPNRLISTHNGGVSFDTAIVADNLVTDVFFVSATVAYAAGKSIWKTIDGGYNWTKLYDFTVLADYNSLYFINEQTGWVIRTGGLYKTTNGGVDWQLISTPTFDLNTTRDVFFLNSNTGYISDELSVGKTINTGTSWSKAFTGVPTYHDIHFVTDNIGYITDGPRIYKTADAGTTWTKEVVLAASSLLELHFTDVNHGWACGSGGIILKFNQ
jgi:photosystem II stability/assembly factor-like uncharacterized protein